MSAVIPNTKPMFAMLDPITFPHEISLKPFTAACTLTSDSGADVAKETTVRPMTIFDSLSLNESPTEARTKNSPPTTNNNNPKNRNSTLILYR